MSHCQNNIQKYKKLKIKIKATIDKLSDASTNTNSLCNEIKSRYQIDDGDTPIAIRVKKLKSNIDKTNLYLNNNILPAIDEEISNLYKEISHLEKGQAEK